MRVNIIGIILFMTGIIVVIYGFVSAYMHSNYVRSIDMSGQPATSIDWTGFFMMASSPLMYGMVLIGVSEIIRILHKQQFNSAKMNESKNTESKEAIREKEDSPDTWVLDEADEEKIYELYSDKAILEIIPTHKKAYCIIKLQEKDGPLRPYLKVVDVGGFGAKEVHNEETRQEIMNWYENQD